MVVSGTTLEEWLVSVLGRWSVVKTLFGCGVPVKVRAQWTRTKNNGTDVFYARPPVINAFLPK